MMEVQNEVLVQLIPKDLKIDSSRPLWVGAVGSIQFLAKVTDNQFIDCTLFDVQANRQVMSRRAVITSIPANVELGPWLDELMINKCRELFEELRGPKKAQEAEIVSTKPRLVVVGRGA